MSVVKHEHDYEITPEVTIKVLWGLGDGDNGMIDETFGLEIEVDEWDTVKDEIHGINLFTFGYESWSQEVWERFGSYLDGVIQDVPKTREGFNAFYDWLLAIDCMYTKDENHLKDLPKILEWIQYEI